MNYVRVVNQQTLVRSILIDKIDKSQGNSLGYAQRAKQKVYVPYVNPNDTAVKGYIDLVPTDDVLLSADRGTIKGLSTAGKVTFSVVSGTLIKASTVTSASNVAGTTSINGTTFTSVSPDVTYATLTNLAGATQTLPSSAFNSFSGTTITILDGAVTIGVPTTGWKVRIKANSKLSNLFTL